MSQLNSSHNRSERKAESPQIDRFKEAARQLEANESEAEFDENLRAVARAKPSKENTNKKTDQ